jgi:signal transduction histidine kinase
MAPDRHAAARRRLLIVDDDVDFAESLADLLASQGYDCAIADRPETALAERAKSAPAVAILDVRLRVASGVDLLSQLMQAQPGLVCVMMTAHADTETAVKALRSGAYDYFDKSCAPSELFAVLDRCFEKLQLQHDTHAAAEALRLAKEEAEAASRAKSQFLANMSHELRTPLNAIIGFSQLMVAEKLGPIGNDKYRSYIGDIYQSGKHLLGIINDILDLSKAEAGKLDLTEDVVDIRHAIEDSCRLIRPRVEHAGQRLTLLLPASLPQLRVDERKLKQILLNLLSNAVKFTPAGGAIEVGAGFDERTGVAIVVRDTGIGIAAEHIAKVLEPFFQVDGAWSRRQEGSGLGLPLVAKMMAAHGGRLALDSELGKGTAARLEFPLSRVVLASAAA